MVAAGNIILYIASAFPLIGLLWSFKDTVPFAAWFVFAILGMVMAGVGGALQAIGSRQGQGG